MLDRILHGALEAGLTGDAVRAHHQEPGTAQLPVNLGIAVDPRRRENDERVGGLSATGGSWARGERSSGHGQSFALNAAD